MVVAATCAPKPHHIHTSSAESPTVSLAGCVDELRVLRRSGGGLATAAAEGTDNEQPW